VPDIAEFVYEAASHLARSREALRRQDEGALRAAVLALRDASEAAGAERMLALCGNLRILVAEDDRTRETILDAIADEFDQVTSELQTARSA
jgi:HPt (histidine-containing phosphotransfer) domain-containing protein